MGIYYQYRLSEEPDQCFQSHEPELRRNGEPICLTGEFVNGSDEEVGRSHRSGVATRWQGTNDYAVIADMVVLLAHSHRNSHSVNVDHSYG
jgi:hypothetical protein